MRNFARYAMLTWITILILTILTVGHNGNVSRSRSRRVLNGRPILEQDMGYNAMLYFTWLGVGHVCPGFFSSLFKDKCVITPNNLICGGALVTSQIVMTAAHCLVTIKPQDDIWSAYTVKSEWENLLNAIVGYRDIALLGSFHGIQSKKFLVHQKYGKLKQYGLARNDYGWVILSKGFPSQPAFFSQAPLYDLATHSTLYQHVNSQQWACLYIGFGKFELKGQASAVLRHHWGMAVEYYDTLYFISEGWYGAKIPFEYRDSATWTWLRPFGNHSSSILSGDSGSPVSCGNYHFAVAAAFLHTEYNGGKNLISIVDSLAFIPYETALEYRRAFTEAVDLYKEKGMYPIFDPTFTPPQAPST